MAEWKRYKYVCTNPKCKAETTSVELGENRPIAMLQCTECKAGYGMELIEQVNSGKGMRLVSNEPIESWGMA
jgi:uncharacterized protein YlaI